MNPPRFESSPDRGMAVLAFAESLARKHRASGGDAAELFAAFAGVVWERDPQIAYDCLEAVDKYQSSLPLPSTVLE